MRVGGGAAGSPARAPSSRWRVVVTIWGRECRVVSLEMMMIRVADDDDDNNNNDTNNK